MKKRITAFILSIVMAISLLPTQAFAVEGTTEVYIDNQTITAGTATITVPVMIKNASAFMAMGLKFEFDTNVFTLTNATMGSALAAVAPGGMITPGSSGIDINFDNSADVTPADGELIVLTFSVKEGATGKDYTITPSVSDNGWFNYNEDDVTATFKAGTITIKYETTGLSFVSGTQTGIDFDYAQKEAMKTEGYTLTKPDTTNTYHFAGWFTGLDVTADDNGFYVVDGATTFTGTELQPRYDTPPTEGEYHALWVKGDGTYVLAQNGTTNTVCADMATAISTANGGTVKLLHDLTLSAAITTAVKLDLNGCTLSGSQVFNAQSSAVSILSSRAGGAFTSTDGYNTNKFGSLTMKDCTYNYTGTNAYASPIIVYGASTIDNCIINTKGRALNVQNGTTATITNTTVTSSSAQAPFMGVGALPPDTQCSGTIVLGAGNTVTASSATQLFYRLAAINFAATDGSYQISPTGVLYGGEGTPTITVADGMSYGFSNGVLQFGTPCTVTYKGEGNVDITKTAMVGANADLSVTWTYGDGKEYKHGGWTTQQGGTTPLTQLTLTGDTTLYSIKQEMNILINGVEVNDTTYTKAVHGSTMPFMHFENVKKLGNLEAFTLTNGKYQMTLKADALDSIAQNCVSMGVTAAAISLVNDSANKTETAVARVNLSVNKYNGNVTTTQTGNQVIPFTGAVEVKIPFTPEAGKNYRAYYIPESGEPEAFATQIVTEGSTTYAVFTTSHFSTFEVRETEVADGYTAGLSTTTTEVRAGGNPVTVYVAVTHSEDSTFNAGEIKVSYDPNLLTPVTDSLPEGTFKVENGVLTIETYGDNKACGDQVYALTFTTCDSVTADTTTNITLTGAAFADKADAVSEDLIVATREPAAVTVSILVEAFAVTKDDTVVTGADEAVKGEDYEFSVDKDEHYTYDVTATVNGTEVTVTEDPANPGKYTIAGDDVTGPITITVKTTANEYDVTFKGETPAANDGAKATHDTAYKFTLPTKAQWQYSYTITIDGEAYTGATSENNVVTIPGADITGAIEITISGEQTEFNMNVTGSDYTIADEDGDGNYEKGEDVTITIIPAEGYTYTVTAKDADGNDVTVKDNGDNTYTIEDISSDLTITITKSLIGTVKVDQYIQVDGLSMFLVTYTGDLAEGYIPHYNDNGEDKAMYWSSQYSAYAYLVVAETLAEEDAKAAVSVKSGTKTEINYTMNVNGSTNIDAADAQLVYDMYQAEYSDFETVSMLKFLLADVNNTRNVNTEDAAAIISYVLNSTAAG